MARDLSFIFLKILIVLFDVNGCFARMGVCVPPAPIVHGSPKSALEPLPWKSQMVVSCHVGRGPWKISLCPLPPSGLSSLFLSCS